MTITSTAQQHTFTAVNIKNWLQQSPALLFTAHTLTFGNSSGESCLAMIDVPNSPNVNMWLRANKSSLLCSIATYQSCKVNLVNMAQILTDYFTWSTSCGQPEVISLKIHSVCWLVYNKYNRRLNTSTCTQQIVSQLHVKWHNWKLLTTHMLT